MQHTQNNAYHATMTSWIAHLRRGMAWLMALERDLILPPSCVFCEQELSTDREKWPFCLACEARLVPQEWHGCSRCGGKRSAEDAPSSHCPLCWKSQLRFDAAVPLGSYPSGLNTIVLQMKNPAHSALAAAVGDLLASRRRTELLQHDPNVVIPIPMFWRRRFHRGANSPEIIASRLGKSLGLPVRRNVLVRCRNTPPQAHLPPMHRFRNVLGAFRVQSPNAVQGARVLLVDDVLTTGATCSEAAKMLKKAGADTVIVAVIARAQGQL